MLHHWGHTNSIPTGGKERGLSLRKGEGGYQGENISGPGCPYKTGSELEEHPLNEKTGTVKRGQSSLLQPELFSRYGRISYKEEAS